MSAVSGLLGTAGGTNGTGFNVQTPISNQQVQNALTTGTQALQQQQGLAQQYAPAGQQALASQQQLLAQLGQEAQGQGPNPALNQLAQATGANTSNQAALMAGQRGASQNAGLIARQAAQQGAQNQQQAAGQAATLSAQQQLANQQQLAAQQAQLTGQQMSAQSTYTQAAQGNQNALLNAVQGQNATQAGLANTVMQGQQSLISGITGGAGAALGLAEGGIVQRYAEGTPTQPVQDPQALQAPQTLGLNATPALNTQSTTQPAQSGPQSKVGQHLTGMNQAGNVIGTGIGKGLNAIGSGIASLFSSTPSNPQGNGETQYSASGMSPQDMQVSSDRQAAVDVGGISAQDAAAPLPTMAHGGKVPALVSPGEQYLKPKDVKKVMKGKDPLKAGERIPGKPKHPGNDYRNDTVRKNLDEGGVVIPNSIMQSNNPHWEAMKFVHATIKRIAINEQH